MSISVNNQHKLTDEQKLIILRLINERKDVLFAKVGEYSSEQKKDTWQEIIEECRRTYGFEAVGKNKGIEHLRDHVWGDMKQRVMKMLRQGQTGRFTGIDAAVMEVMEQPVPPNMANTSRRIPGPSATATVQSTVSNVLTSPDRPISRRRQTARPSSNAAPSEHDYDALERAEACGNGIIGMLPVYSTPIGTGAHVLNGDRSLTGLRKRSHCLVNPDVDEDDEYGEMKQLRKQLLIEQVRHYQLMNEKLQLEIDALRSPLDDHETSFS